MIAYRTPQNQLQAQSGRCPLRRPRIWLWALAVALPAHIGLVWGLEWAYRLTGSTLVACPVSNPLRVTLQTARPTPQPPLRGQQARPVSQIIPKSNPVANLRPFPTKPAIVASAAARVPAQLAALEPAAAAPSGAAAGGNHIIPLAQLGFAQPPQPAPYPPASRAKGEEGTATLLALVANAGTPQKLKLEASSGYQRLDAAALTAAASWHFNAPPQPTWVRLPVRFALLNE